MRRGNPKILKVSHLPMKDTILAACIDISSHPSFSRLMVSGSALGVVLGKMGCPDGANPRICERNELKNSALGLRILADLHSNAGCPSSLKLVLVTEQTDTGLPSSVIQYPFEERL
jgi:hypothetical protein